MCCPPSCVVYHAWQWLGGSGDVCQRRARFSSSVRSIAIATAILARASRPPGAAPSSQNTPLTPVRPMRTLIDSDRVGRTEISHVRTKWSLCNTNRAGCR